MKGLIFILFIAEFFSFKSKQIVTKIISESEHSTLAKHPEINYRINEHNHFHYYKIYKGKFKPTKNETGQIRTCKFKNKKMKYFYKDIPALDSGKNIWVYYLKDNNDTYIIAVNPKIDKYHKPRMMKEGNNFIEETVGRGDYGCIPKFIQDENDNLKIETEVLNKQRYLNLIIAKHIEINSIDSTVSVLKTHKFLIANSDYDSLQVKFRANNFIQGGVNKIDTTKLNIFNEKGEFLLTVDNTILR